MTVVFYVSGHGFGHASRVIEVVNALAARCPDVAIHVRTRAARWLFDLTVRAPFTLDVVDVDVGVIQIDALRPDVEATLTRAAAFYAGSDALIAREAEALRACGASLVIADAPPLAFAAAARVGVPAILLGNFTWSWIYRDYEIAHGRDTAVSDRLRTWETLASETWRLPMQGGFDHLARIRDLPFVARHSHRAPGELRAALGWTDGRRVVLSSFGGVGMRGLPLEEVARASDLRLVVTNESQMGSDLISHIVCDGDDGTTVLDERGLYDCGWRYEDVVAAADVVVTKPGYGIIAECLANDTAMLYTSRGRFAEYGVLVDALPRLVRSRFISQEDLLAGRWADPIRALLAQARPDERPATNGADVAASWIEERLERRVSA